VAVILLAAGMRPIRAAGATDSATVSAPVATADNYAQARVVKILATKNVWRDNSTQAQQQNLQLQILSGPLAGQEVQYHGISEVEVTGSDNYQVGDQVALDYSAGPDGQNVFYITNYIRQNVLGWLLLLFIAIILLIGRGQGFKALLSLVLSFLFIIKVMTPLMLHGFDPLLIGGLGSFIILLIIVYLTGGINKKSHVAVLSILLSLTVTAVLAVIFSNLAHLTGTAQEEVTYLLEAGSVINFQGLLLAALIIGTLGILDDIVVGQVEVVAQIKALNPNLPLKKTFLMSMEVGRAHLGAVVNTLFLAYVAYLCH
jgi:uncharacterized membrane protein